jgi:hypothetical protein
LEKAIGKIAPSQPPPRGRSKERLIRKFTLIHNLPFLSSPSGGVRGGFKIYFYDSF